jgi:hypothetical protein
LFRNRPIRNKNCLWRPCLLADRDEMNNLYRGPSIHALRQVSFHLAMRFQRRIFFRIQTFRNKIFLWRPCLKTDRIKMDKFHRGPIKDASYQVLVHLVKRFQSRRFFRNRPIRKNKLLVATLFYNGSKRNEQSL